MKPGTTVVFLFRITGLDSVVWCNKIIIILTIIKGQEYFKNHYITYKFWLWKLQSFAQSNIIMFKTLRSKSKKEVKQCLVA